MKVLAIGDLVGNCAIKELKMKLPKIYDEEKIDFVIVNGENVAEGIGNHDNGIGFRAGQQTDLLRSVEDTCRVLVVFGQGDELGVVAGSFKLQHDKVFYLFFKTGVIDIRLHDRFGLRCSGVHPSHGKRKGNGNTRRLLRHRIIPFFPGTGRAGEQDTARQQENCYDFMDFHNYLSLFTTPYSLTQRML